MSKFNFTKAQVLAERAQKEALAQAEADKQIQIKAHQDYLNETDWYVVRFMETGVAIPDVILLAREEAREAISELRD